MGRGHVVPWIVCGALLPLLAGWALWIHWRVTGDYRLVAWFFHYVTPPVLVGLPLCQSTFAFRAWREFSPKQPMWAVWGGLTVAAVSQAVGAVFSQIVGVDTPLNPWPALASDPSWRAFGITLGGPVHLALLLVSFAIAVPVYRSFGWRTPPRWHDWGVVLLAASYVAMQARDLVLSYPEELRRPARLLSWLMDPLLVVLLILAFVLWRSAGSLEGGLTGLCWGCYGLGILLTLLGNFANWTVWSQRLKWSDASVISWYIWIPAYAGFALGPALQVEAIRFVMQRRGSTKRAGSGLPQA